MTGELFYEEINRAGLDIPHKEKSFIIYIWRSPCPCEPPSFPRMVLFIRTQFLGRCIIGALPRHTFS